jgi:hypothetical protein
MLFPPRDPVRRFKPITRNFCLPCVHSQQKGNLSLAERSLPVKCAKLSLGRSTVTSQIPICRARHVAWVAASAAVCWAAPRRRPRYCGWPKGAPAPSPQHELDARSCAVGPPYVRHSSTLDSAACDWVSTPRPAPPPRCRLN